MAEAVLHSDALTCPVCLDLLKEPVTIRCGHSYCKNCLEKSWAEDSVSFRCPQCRKRYRRRPVLNKNIMLADLVEQLQRTAPPADLSGPQDVSCDLCPAQRKLKAVRSCLQCVVSYCDSHLQPHHTVAVLHTHQLVAPSHKLKENLCPQHHRLKEFFCRTDQELLCSLCVEQHKGHDTVSSADERAQRQVQQEASRDRLLHHLQDIDIDLELLQQKAQSIHQSAQREVRLSGDSFRNMALLLEKERSRVELQILCGERQQVKRVQDLQERLKQEATELRKNISALEELSNTKDHNHFILHCPTLPTERKEGRVQTEHQQHSDQTHRRVIGLSEKLKLVLHQFMFHQPEGAFAWSLSLGAPSRQQLMCFRQDISLDPNTANPLLLLSEGNRRLRCQWDPLEYQEHPDRFTHWPQVLSQTGTMERAYWEVDVSEARLFCAAVAYKDIERKGSAARCTFGYDEKSWALERDQNDCRFCHCSNQIKITGAVSSIIGIFVDHRAGTLCVYSVFENGSMNLLHEVHTTFTRPLYFGLGLNHSRDTVLVNPPTLNLTKAN